MFMYVIICGFTREFVYADMYAYMHIQKRVYVTFLIFITYRIHAIRRVHGCMACSSIRTVYQRNGALQDMKSLWNVSLIMLASPYRQAGGGKGGWWVKGEAGKQAIAAGGGFKPVGKKICFGLDHPRVSIIEPLELGLLVSSIPTITKL